MIHSYLNDKKYKGCEIEDWKEISSLEFCSGI
jgi:hypothetical protein